MASPSPSSSGKRKSRKRNNGNKKVEKIDLSVPNGVSGDGAEVHKSQFEVTGYTHELPDQEQSQFENDLDYLLHSDPNGVKSPGLSVKVSESIEIEPIVNNNEPKESKSSSRNPKKSKISLEDVTKDMDEIQFSSDSDDEVIEKPPKKGKQKKKSAKPAMKPANTPTPELEVSESDTKDGEEPIDFHDFINEQSKAKDSRRKERNKKRTERRLKAKRLAKETEANDDQNTPTLSPVSLSSTPEPVSDKSSPKEIDCPTFPFDVKLRQTSKSALSNRFTENLPQIQPKSTIIGLSYKQILKLDTADVKIKTIASSAAISKYAATALKFCMKHTEDIFGVDNIDAKDIFIILCINVALFESVGFKKTSNLYPNVLQLFGEYEEINLDTTRTKLTPSNKDIHQNNLDYSVLSYVGNILIWANHIQHENDIRLSIKHRSAISASIIKQNFGGYHLWDKLIRESRGMNAKRWKHIVKFRQNFPLEEQQFILILRYMNVLEPPT